uniref:hypothetical protein n=1 Tax=Collinsella intestinalis TaxID=147207 RepID=UPI0040270714
MKFDARITRRSLIAAAATLLLAGCGAGGPAGSAPSGSAGAGSAHSDPVAAVAWEAALDPEAPFMNVAATPGECWMQHEDGTVQVQVAGSSIPEPAVESVEFADGVLTLTMAQPDEDTPATMDFVLHQFMVSGADAPKVAAVVLVRGEETVELPAGELAELEAVE